MDTVATDVAKPPRAGGELPDFEELLARGSFHARLARARVEREKALKRADDENDFILNPRRKPWETQDVAGARRDPLVVALQAVTSTDAGRAAARPLGAERHLNPDRARAESPGADVLLLWPNGGTQPGFSRLAPADASVRLHAVVAGIPAAPARVEARAPDARPVRGWPQAVRRAAMVGGGFAAGLAVGLATAAILPLLVPAVSIIRTTPPAVAAAPAAPAMRSPEPAMPAVPVALAAPSFRTALPGLPIADGGEAALVSPVSGTLSVAGSGPVQPRATFAPDPAPDPAPMPIPISVSRAEDRVPARLERADLAPGAVADGGPSGNATAPLPSGVDATAVSGGPELPGFGPAAEVGALVPAAPAGLVRPVAVVALPPAMAEPPDAAPAPQALASPPGPRFAGPVVVNAPATIEEAALAALVGELGAGGFVLAEPNRVDITISESNVRFFHPEDAAAAEAVATALGAVPRDFTAFSPAPPEGTIEVWLAGRGAGAAPAKARRASGQGAMTPSERELNALRARILQQLQNGEHL